MQAERGPGGGRTVLEAAPSSCTGPALGPPQIPLLSPRACCEPSGPTVRGQPRSPQCALAPIQATSHSDRPWVPMPEALGGSRRALGLEAPANPMPPGTPTGQAWVSLTQ